jgi:hypothetical protein
MSGIIYIDGVPEKFTRNIIDYADRNVHREDGPAVIWPDAAKEWWVNGKRHREGGPAFEGIDGYKAWYLNGKLHREDGPAIEIGTMGYNEWHLNGVFYYSFKEYLKQLPVEKAVLLALEWL